MGATIIEKILANASGLDRVNVGDILVCEVDTIMMLDLAFTTASEPLPKRMDHPERVVVILDHSVPAPTIADADGQRVARQFVKDWGIDRFFDIGNHGIVHQLALEKGLARPGEVVACTDSHTCAVGAANAAGRGMGRLEMVQIMCTGKTWYKLAPTVLYRFAGAKPAGVYGKDVFLHIAGVHGDHVNQNVEFGGPGLSNLTMDDRATIATMCAEISAEFATFPYDAVLGEYLASVGVTDPKPVHPDEDATYLDIRDVNLSDIQPMVARPEYVPGNTVPVSEVSAQKIDQAFIGSCANGKLTDIASAAAIMRGRKVADGVRLIVTPASTQIYLDSLRLGYVETLVAAGAVVTNSTCGACWGGHMGVVGSKEVCVTSSTRNFKGRMGAADAEIYLASSATVAASAVTGHLTDPREYLAGADDIPASEHLERAS
jgi:3-isopropylmalate/(R)-2-methylmalate dehydratase large subunit